MLLSGTSVLLDLLGGIVCEGRESRINGLMVFPTVQVDVYLVFVGASGLALIFTMLDNSLSLFPIG